MNLISLRANREQPVYIEKEVIKYEDRIVYQDVIFRGVVMPFSVAGGWPAGFLPSHALRVPPCCALGNCMHSQIQ